MLNIELLGTGRGLPTKKWTMSDIKSRLSPSLKLMPNFPCVETRYFCSEETQIDLALEACENALKAAGKTAGDIDLIISGSAVAFQPIPTTAPLIMQRLGILDGQATAFDVNSTCLSFLTGLETASRMIDARQHKCAIIVSSEVSSRALPWQDDPETASLFGDGAGAVVIGPTKRGNSSQITTSMMKCYPSAYDACQIASGGTRFDYRNDQDDFEKHTLFQMDGRALFKLTARHFSDFVNQVLDHAGWTKEMVDVVVPHQASPGALAHMIKLTGFDPERVVNIASSFGNQIAASIPFALDHAIENGRIQRGHKVLLVGTSAGVSFGGMAIEF